MIVNYRPANKMDLIRIMDIENLGFSSEEAASETAMKERIELISDSFIVATNEKDTPVGYVVGPVIPVRYLYDELFEKTVPNPKSGGYQSILSLAIDPNYQKYGIASKLLSELADISRKRTRSGITLTCLESLIPFYLRNGYKLEGLSDSSHAGETWYNMVLDLEAEI